MKLNTESVNGKKNLAGEVRKFLEKESIIYTILL